MQDMIPKIQVNVPFRMLYDEYLDRFLKHRINPEIGIDAPALEGFTFADFNRIGKIFHEHALTVTLHGPFIDLSAGSKDPGRVVIDEIAGYLLTMIGSPPDVLPIVAGFLLFRLFDILKPPPIKYLERALFSGLGVMADDLMAGVYAWCAGGGSWKPGPGPRAQPQGQRLQRGRRAAAGRGQLVAGFGRRAERAGAQ